jgi:hypothetical protein
MKKYGILFSLLLSTSMIHSMQEEEGKLVSYGDQTLRVINSKPINPKHQNNILKKQEDCNCIEYPQCHHMTTDLDNTILTTFKSVNPLLFAGSALLVAIWHWYLTSQSLVV